MINLNTLIPQSDDRLFSYFLKETLEVVFQDNKKVAPPRKVPIELIVLGLILIVGTEPLKVVLRRNIGKLSISMPRTAVASILYIVWAAMMIGLGFGVEKLKPFSLIFTAGGILYFLFGMLALLSGLGHYFRAKRIYHETPADFSTHLYRGESKYFGHLLAKGHSQERIWVVVEPRACFITGLILTALPIFIHPALSMLGAPILVSSISFWFNEWYQVNNVWNVQAKKIYKEQVKQSQQQTGFGTDEFNAVN